MNFSNLIDIKFVGDGTYLEFDNKTVLDDKEKREANQEDHAEDCKNLKADCQQKFETIKEKLTTGKKV